MKTSLSGDGELLRRSWLWEADNHMDVVWHHTKFDNGDVMPLCDFPQHIFTKFLNFLALEHLVAVFRAPFQMVYILAYAMVIAN